MPFKIGKTYTSQEIINQIGGSAVPLLPVFNGEVVCCRLKPELNPNFPKELWIAKGERRKLPAENWAKSKKCIPTFVKQATNCYEYKGKFKSIQIIRDKARLAIANKTLMPLGPVQLILELEECKL